MDGIAEMFAELDGYDRYEAYLAERAVVWGLEATERTADWKRRNPERAREHARRYQAKRQVRARKNARKRKATREAARAQRAARLAAWKQRNETPLRERLRAGMRAWRAA